MAFKLPYITGGQFNSQHHSRSLFNFAISSMQAHLGGLSTNVKSVAHNLGVIFDPNRVLFNHVFSNCGTWLKSGPSYLVQTLKRLSMFYLLPFRLL